MRPSRRILLLLCATTAVLLGIIVPASVAQLPAQLPPKWNDAVHSLAGKISIASGGPGKISLDVKNISSLNAVDTNAIQLALKDELTQRHIHFTPPASAETQVHVTLSESTEGLVWVAEIHHGDARQVAIVIVPESADGSGDRARESLSLDHRLIWEQQAKVLDFALVNPSAGPSPVLVILEPGRIVFYRTADSQGQFWRTIDIPHPGPWPRDLRGSIDAVAGKVWLPGIQCSADLENPDGIECVPQTKQMERPLIVVPGHEGTETVAISEKCGGSVVLTSGTGDWTQPDSIQGYVLSDSQGPAIASGDPVQFDGPIMSLQPENKEAAARAVVRNLNTGNYEAYIVSATCSY